MKRYNYIDSLQCFPINEFQSKPTFIKAVLDPNPFMFFVMYRPKPEVPTLRFCFTTFISLLIDLLNGTGLNSRRTNKFAAKKKSQNPNLHSLSM